AERIGWDRGLTILKERVRELRPAYLPVDPVSRTVYSPGELAQCDLWFPPADIPLGYGQTGRPPVLVMVSGYSRMITARMLPSRTTADLIDGHWRLLSGWQAVPKMLVRDNESGVGQGRLTSEFAAFAGLLAIRIHLCRPRDPEASPPTDMPPLAARWRRLLARIIDYVMIIGVPAPGAAGHAHITARTARACRNRPRADGRPPIDPGTPEAAVRSEVRSEAMTIHRWAQRDPSADQPPPWADAGRSAWIFLMSRWCRGSWSWGWCR
ncbi:DDE-type integrase/transposase/recombinase, partial [Streptomyces sp. NPDC057611]|uniref:DDE-type integrase/transposase/recombinase n=1 Tax=Streptomyces sp. NPDC057611 TaxID=3346182 RepID=UPI0036844E74